MKTNRSFFRAQVAALSFASVVMLGCSDLLGAGEPDVDLEMADLEPGIHAVLVMAGQTGNAATVELHLIRVEVTDRIASFQGELRYDPERMTLTSAQVPQGITGAWNETEPGTVRFAGISTEGIEDSVVLSIAFDAAAVLRADAFELTIEELIAVEAFQNLAPSLSQEGPRQPRLLSRLPR